MLGLIGVYNKGKKIGEVIALKGDKGEPLKYEDLTAKQKADLRGIAIERKTESEYAAITPESGVLYIVTSDT